MSIWRLDSFGSGSGILKSSCGRGIEPQGSRRHGDDLNILYPEWQLYKICVLTCLFAYVIKKLLQNIKYVARGLKTIQ